MNKKTSFDHKKKYAIAKHHAWAGSILLAVLLAIRVFIDTSEGEINNLIFIILSTILIIYILIALIITYKHHSGLMTYQINDITSSVRSDDGKKALLKNQLKVKKKKTKSEVKKIKKQQKNDD